MVNIEQLKYDSAHYLLVFKVFNAWQAKLKMAADLKKQQGKGGSDGNSAFTGMKFIFNLKRSVKRTREEDEAK